MSLPVGRRSLRAWRFLAVIGATAALVAGFQTPASATSCSPTHSSRHLRTHRVSEPQSNRHLVGKIPSPQPYPIAVGQTCNIPAGDISSSDYAECAGQFGSFPSQGATATACVGSVGQLWWGYIASIGDSGVPLTSNTCLPLGLWTASAATSNTPFVFTGSGPATITIASVQDYPSPPIQIGQTCSNLPSEWANTQTDAQDVGHVTYSLECQGSNQFGMITSNVWVTLENTGNQEATFAYTGLHGDSDTVKVAAGESAKIGEGAGHYNLGEPGDYLEAGLNSGDPKGFTTIEVTAISSANENLRAKGRSQKGCRSR